MNLEEATKKVRAEKPKENYMLVELASYTKFLLPHTAGVALLNALAIAERLQDSYGEPKRIVELERNSIETRMFSAEEYQRYKIAALLNLTPDEVKEAQLLAAQPPPTPSQPP